MSAAAVSQHAESDAPRTHHVLQFVAVGAGLAVFVGLIYCRLLFTNRVLASGDILHYFYPYRDYASAALREGRIPLWNPYIFTGAPFLANPQAAVLYPLHWPLSWLPVTKQIAWSAAFHTWLLGMGGYALMRHWRGSVWAGATTAVVLAGSGFYGGLLGHINQMNGAAWLPWAALVLDVGSNTTRLRGVFRSDSRIAARVVAFGALTALMFLAGHTQTLYINLFGLGVWAVWPLVQGLWGHWDMVGLRAGWSISAPRLIVLAGGGALGLLISGAQLLPTLELSGLGLRSGGLTYAEAVSFSLRPLQVHWSLLPSYGLADLGVVFDTLGYTEYVAYVGLIGLAFGLLGAWRGGGAARQFGLLMAGIGLFLALGRWNPAYYLFYRIVPGFDLFRAPARWMMLYTLGMAVLAGLGMDVALRGMRAETNRRARYAIAAALTFLLAGELLIAARSLPHTHPTAPQAVYDVRTAPAHLLTDPAREAIGPGAAGRFLSMSTILFDPGDMADYARILLGDSETGAGAQLDQAAFEQLIVALKAQEILAPNLALLRRIPSLDGFDGGVLPLRRYLDMLALFIPPNELVPDGRLREQVRVVPDADALGMLNVQYVITDKVRDLWFEDVYYDRQIGARLGEGGVDEIVVHTPYAFEATHVDVIGFVDAEDVAPTPTTNWTAATVTALDADSSPISEWHIMAGPQPGAQFADGALNSQMAEASDAVVAYRDVEGERQEYRVRLPMDDVAAPAQLVVRHADGPDVVVQAITLFDERTGMFLALVPSDRGHFERVHSGDVKVYENLDALPRVYMVSEVIPAADGEEAIDLVRSGQYDPRRTAVVEGGRSLTQAGKGIAELTAYTNEQVTVRTSGDADGYLVLSDAYYPGWQATIDGEDTPVYATNHLLRGVYVPAGDHTVVFQFTPDSWRHGVWMSLAGLLAAIGLMAWPSLRRARK